MEINFTDYINDAVRILILLNEAKSRKSLAMTERKIMLFDYYLKFPHTMLSDLSEMPCDLQTLDEYYAFFHWQPDIIRYRRSINYLIAKGFVEKVFDKNHTLLRITCLGEEVVGQISTTYKNRMEKLLYNQYLSEVDKKELAYYMALLIVGSVGEYYHPNLLIIDSPRKNLGAQNTGEDDEEFKDEKIFNATIRYLYNTVESRKTDIQMIVVNNGYPDFLPHECVVAEFDADELHGLPKGLIDDAVN